MESPKNLQYFYRNLKTQKKSILSDYSEIVNLNVW